jgi:threonine/homoserine/homoserine lactone efflux protein
MEGLTLFGIGLFFSYIGSIPPGSINISVLQLAMAGHRTAAVRFTIVASIVEFVYAYIAVKFQQLILSSQILQDNFKLIAAVVLIVLGLLSLRSGSGQKGWEKKLETSGLRKGFLVSIANPLAIPFWIAITAYLETNNWISLNSSNEFIYIAGISAGTIALLFTLVFLGSRASRFMANQERAKKIPGFVLLGLGIYSLVQLTLEVVTR